MKLLDTRTTFDLVKLLVFIVVTTLATSVLVVLIGNLSFTPTHEYRAEFVDATGVVKGDDVRIAGVKVGKVTSVDLENAHVRVNFTVNRSTELGSTTSAAVRIKTILGQKFLSLDPAGKANLDKEIPLSRTTPAYDVVDAFSDLATTEEKINTDLVRAITSPEVTKRYADAGVEVAPGTSEQFAEFARNEHVKWAKVVRDSGASAD